MLSPVHRLYVERREGFDNEARRARADLVSFLGISALQGVRFVNRYDIQGLSPALINTAAAQIFAEPQSDIIYQGTLPLKADETVIAIEYLPGQYDQRSDSAEQCIALLPGAGDGPVTVRTARLFVLQGNLSARDLERIRGYLINPVDSRESGRTVPETLDMCCDPPGPVPVLDGFTALDEAGLAAWHEKTGLAMDIADARFLQQYFRTEGRDPTETEIRVLDTYWSDHCRHTTFNTILGTIEIADSPAAPAIREALETYSGLRAELYTDKNKPVTLMDIAVIGAKALRKRGLLNDLEESAEINACSLFIDVALTDETGRVTGTEPWLLLFKNETHNHPTEIEPFGGAATCIGGAIRDPLSGRAWVYQALRVTGAGDPTVSLEQTIPGKLPQVKITREAAAGFASYGNQIGLATGQVVEYYDPGFLAKRMELGAVIAAVPVSHVVREEPEAGDIVVLVGGGTGRDGIGGATGSSKAHTAESVATAGAEVQKGNAVEERKIQRLFRDPEVTRLIRRCNDFGAGGVSVAVGELAPGLRINLDAVPRKYEGLNGTELAISESQERMAVVIRASDRDRFMAAAARENLNSAVIAEVTAEARLVMTWQGTTIVDIDREFLDTAGASRTASVRIDAPKASWNWLPQAAQAGSLEQRWHAVLSDLSVASQRGLGERFDGSIGSASILFPMGGRLQSTPECGMAARIPVGPGRHTRTASLMTMGYDPRALSWSPFHGAQYAVLESLTKILALGGDPSRCRLTFQEYFERTASPEAWGKPAAALLGALTAQLASGCAAIGGKDSMSGTFQELTVPPTLVSFAVCTADQDTIRGGSLQKAGHNLYLLHTPWKEDNTPDWQAFSTNSTEMLALSSRSAVSSAYPVTAGGIAAALSKMAFGNRIGAAIDADSLRHISLPSVFTPDCSTKPGDTDHTDILFAPLYGSLIVELPCGIEPAGSNWHLIGTTTAEPYISFAGSSLCLEKAQAAWEAPLARVFPPVSGMENHQTLPEWAVKSTPLTSVRTARPRNKAPHILTGAKPGVILPVFPGTNCEYDMARAFTLAGAETRILPLRNRSAAELASSLDELADAIQQSHILALSGGFSAGDEPDGSGKFIAAILREKQITDAVMDLHQNRKGLILGICNGFQALIKVGLVPYGKILPPDESMPTLTYNTVGRHISRFVRTRITSDSSAWAGAGTVLHGKIHTIPVSHGEGRVIINEPLARTLFEQGQVFSQYVTDAGIPTLTEPDNPNGSAYAIEGLTDETGRILGKMGHSERPIDRDCAPETGPALYKNIPGDTCQNIFAAGVRYFT